MHLTHLAHLDYAFVVPVRGTASVRQASEARDAPTEEREVPTSGRERPGAMCLVRETLHTSNAA